MIQFEESKKLYLDSYREYVKNGCIMNGALFQIKECIDNALHHQYLNKELSYMRIASIECDVSTFSSCVEATFYLLPFEPFTIEDDWSAKEKSIMAEVNDCIMNNGNYFTVTGFNRRLENLKHHITPVKRIIRYFNIETIENMDINNIIIR